MEASLTCAVCLSLFEEPVTLPLCSHNFCRDCVLECLASAEAARAQQQQRGPGQARVARLGPGPGGAAGARVPCPLCRKLCPLPRGGAAALPINTTLAEVVKLYRAGTARASEAEPGPGPSPQLALGGSCPKHPGRLVQLYCRMCRRAGCGQCVSEEHQGIFHSVNLLDTVYQEEKLNFFGSLKKMRIINEKLMNEISSHPHDADIALNNEVEIVVLEFGEILRTLEMKKQQLIEDLENQRSKKEKEFEIWKKIKETQKKTTENFLKDCENLVHECDPQRFLEVACGLNTRMKTHIDLMNIASSYEKPPEYTQKKMDIKPVINEILALKLMPVNADLPSGGSENSTKNITKQWQDQKNTSNTFLPVAGQEEVLTGGARICTRLMSISEMPAFQNMSHEELRYKYYMECQKLSELKTQALPENKNAKSVAAEALKDESSGIAPVSSPTKANNVDRVQMETLLREGGTDEMSFSRANNHSIPSSNSSLSRTSGGSDLVCERSSEEAITPALPESLEHQEMKEKLPMQSSAVTVSDNMDTHSNASLGLKPAASVAVTVSNSEFLDSSADRLCASPFAFGACSNSLPRFIKDAATFSLKKKDSKYAFPKFYLGKCDHGDKIETQDESKSRKQSSIAKSTVSDASTSCNLELAESQKTAFSFSCNNSERECFAASGINNSFKTLSSFFNQSEKPSDQNMLSYMGESTSLKKTAESGTLKQSVSREQNAIASESITTVPYSTLETTIAAGANVTSESPLPHSNCVSSFESNDFQLPSPIFSFGSIGKNNSDSLLLSRNGTDKTEKEQMKSLEKTPLNLGSSVSPECAEPASVLSHPKYEGSFLCMNSSKQTGSADLITDSNSSCSQPLYSAVLPVKDENASSTQITITLTKQKIKVKHQESEVTAESSYSCPGREDEPESVLFQNAACSTPGACSDSPSVGFVLRVNEAKGLPSDSDSDTEELSQTSVSSDTSSASEYFSVAEDKESARRKSET